MTRKKFILSHGATCKNWNWSWSFINEKERFVIFGAWDVYEEGDTVKVLSETWGDLPSGGKSPAYKQAREHIRLVEEEGYQLKTFPMQFSDENQDENGRGPAKIKGFVPLLTNREQRKVGKVWFADSIPNEEKVARVCWNTENWQKPSGLSGKTNNKEAYESINGYGHEEWLLDTTKLINGFHYAYIQAIGSHRDTYIGKTFNISFYSINNKTKQRWWIGQIKNIQIIDEDESKEVYEFYKKEGWYEEMVRQLEQVNANVDAFKKFTTPSSFAVLKYRIEDLNLLDEPLEFSAKDSAILADYYNLKNYVHLPKLFELGAFKFIKGHNAKKGKCVSTYEAHKRQIDLVHNQLQEALYQNLIEIYGKTNVGTENQTGKGTRIDAVVRHKENYSFYEIKTSPSVRQCIRDALGQLLEYAHFENDVQIKEFIIVSPYKITKECLSYLSSIRKKYSLPIIYQQFDLTAKKLLEPYK